MDSFSRYTQRFLHRTATASWLPFVASAAVALAAVPKAGAVELLSEDFNDISTLRGDGWEIINRSEPLGLESWYQGDHLRFAAYEGEDSDYIAVDFASVGDGPGQDTISNWLIMPEMLLADGRELVFYTRTVSVVTWPDRLEVRMSLSGDSVDVGADALSVGDFDTLLLEINPALTADGYPTSWTRYSVVLNGLGLGCGMPGRLAFRYFVTDAGAAGSNSLYIGLDSVTFSAPDLTPADDCNSNGILDTCDIAAGTSQDCNTNGIPDECDLAAGTSQDCNTNGIPDECDLATGTSQDCNTNGIPDECDIAAGTSQDCNTNGIPDECDIAAGTSQDCNTNGIPDECDIAAGTSQDCNTNGIPDECDIAAGTSQDCNTNGIPDECDIAAGTSQDCNTNGIPDECDLATGTSQDCNTNGIPDECDIAAGTSQDCNANGIPDACDIAGNISHDCNADGIPDGCEADTDGDGLIDACDNCPDDATKLDPGACGCGVVDEDVNGDGVPDCLDIDLCPDDPNKTTPGTCGCGVADEDANGDGVPDCLDIDLCPDDPDKTTPGTCGCGVADEDANGDGVPDCLDIDLCPDDPNKVNPGVCGCGVADDDADDNGIPDCIVIDQNTPGAQTTPSTPCEEGEPGLFLPLVPFSPVPYCGINLFTCMPMMLIGIGVMKRARNRRPRQ